MIIRNRSKWCSSIGVGLALCFGFGTAVGQSTTTPKPAAPVAIVLNSGEGTISLVDMGTRKETKRVPIGKEPHHLMITPDDQHLIVANAVSNNLVFLDPATGNIVKRVEKISDPYQIGYSPNKKYFVSASLRLDQTDIYEAQTFKLLKRISTPKAPSHIAFNADSTLTFITLQDTNEVAAIDLATQQIQWKVKVGPIPAGIWMTPDDKHLLVGLTGADGVAST
jgi:YVTN family beta-propeller protein